MPGIVLHADSTKKERQKDNPCIQEGHSLLGKDNMEMVNVQTGRRKDELEIITEGEGWH